MLERNLKIIDESVDVFNPPLKNQTGRNNLTAVYSAVKGCGKTWLAISLSHALSMAKKKILLFDADCGLENMSSQLGLSQSTPYKNLLSGIMTLNNAAVKFDRGRFEVISSLPGDNILHAASAGRIQIMAHDLLQFSKYYDHVLVDCSDDNIQAARIFLNICGTIILMVQSDPISLAKAYKKLQELKILNSAARFKIIINQAFSHDEGNQIYKTLLKAAKEYINIDISLLGIVRQDARIRDSVLNQSLLLSRYPASEGAEDVVLAARQLLKDEINDS